MLRGGDLVRDLDLRYLVPLSLPLSSLFVPLYPFKYCYDKIVLAYLCLMESEMEF